MVYHIQTTVARTLPNLEEFPHHESIEKLWTTKWKFPCMHSIYPFMDGRFEDFEPIFQRLIASDNSIRHDRDAWAAPFIPVAKQLFTAAEEIEPVDSQKAAELYLRAGAIYRIARFPVIRTEKQRDIWRNQKEALRRAGRYMVPQLQEIEIPFQADLSAGDTAEPIQAYMRIPQQAKFANGHPCLIFICGLDGYRADLTWRYERHLADGFAVITFEIPGTGDSPASRTDPNAADRVMSSVLDWIWQHGSRLSFDLSKVCAIGVSTGGYYAIRAAHTHKDRLHSVVSQGGGCHHMFDPAWILMQDKMEYPFDLAESLAYKFGFSSVKEYAEGAKKFSLSGYEDSCKLLLVNGMEDTIFPIEDSFEIVKKGGNKDLMLYGGMGHMAAPVGDEFLYQWLANRVRDRA